MKIGILGSGPVGLKLGQGFAAKGHEVKLGTRDVKKKEVQEWLKSNGKNVSAGNFAETAKFGDMVFLCCLGTAVDDVLKLAGDANLSGKVLVDVTNPLDFSKGMPPGLFMGTNDSLGEKVQRTLPKTKVVKAFNTIGNPTMINPKMQEASPTFFYAGNDEKAKEQVVALAKAFGWESFLDVGGIDGARWLEAMVPLWVRAATKLNTWTPAFKVLKD